MKITQKKIRQIIREEEEKLQESRLFGAIGFGSNSHRAQQLESCGEDNSAYQQMPCPIEAATNLKNSGATESEVLDWVQRLISSFSDRVENDSIETPELYQTDY